MRITDLITIHMETDGTNTSGTFNINSDYFTNTVTYIQCDKGLKLKIWTKEISGAAATIKTEFIPDTADLTTTVTVDVEDFPGGTVEYLEKRKPRIIVCRTGKEGVRFTWSQSTAGKTYVTMEIEVDQVE